MTSNGFYQSAIALIVLAHAISIVWWIVRRDIRPAIFTNILTAAAVLWEQGGHFFIAMEYRDYAILLLLVFETVTLILAIAKFAGVRIPAYAIWLAFAINFALGVPLLIFMFTFKMTRLM